MHTGGNTPPAPQIVIFRTSLFRQGTTPAPFAKRSCQQSPTVTDHRICARAHHAGKRHARPSRCLARHVIVRPARADMHQYAGGTSASNTARLPDEVNAARTGGYIALQAGGHDATTQPVVDAITRWSWCGPPACARWSRPRHIRQCRAGRVASTGRSAIRADHYDRERLLQPLPTLLPWLQPAVDGRRRAWNIAPEDSHPSTGLDGPPITTDHRVMPAACPMGRSVRDCHSHSRIDRQACRPGSQHVAAMAEHP